MWTSPWTRWSIALGFALGGFFDGILLHQILQWHHLLSLVPGFGDLRLQVVWDGYFHALMYGIAAVALWGLWRAHRRSGAAPGRRVAGALLAGFGAWHILDAILSHWLLGIHRIKLDSANPLMWDLLWFAVFGLAPLALGWVWARPSDGTPSRPGLATAALLLLSVGTIGAGAWALRPPVGQPFTTVVFRPGVSPEEALSAVTSLGGDVIWAEPSMGVAVVNVDPARRWALYRRGALLVSGSGVPAGCFGWSKV